MYSFILVKMFEMSFYPFKDKSHSCLVEIPLLVLCSFIIVQKAFIFEPDTVKWWKIGMNRA